MSCTNCAKCNNPPQLPVTLGCGDMYCFLCLKEFMSNGNTGCFKAGCQQQINIDIANVSEDFKLTLLSMIGKNVWLYSSMSKDGWWMYNPNMSKTIETCFGNGLPTCSFLIGTKTYRIQFSNNIQTSINVVAGANDQTQRQVKRVSFTQSKIDQLNIKGIAGMYFKTIEDQIGKFV